MGIAIMDNSEKHSPSNYQDKLEKILQGLVNCIIIVAHENGFLAVTRTSKEYEAIAQYGSTPEWAIKNLTSNYPGCDPQ